MKKIQVIFIITGLLCFLIPIVGFNTKQTVSEVEKRTLSLKPSLIKEGRINSLFFTEFDSYIQDHFGGRNTLIDTANFIDQKILHKKNIRFHGFEGKNGWFYITTDDNFSDFMKTNLFNTTEYSNFKSKVKDIKDWCDENDIKCLFVLCPNKHNIYPEYYLYDRPEGITRSDQMTQIFSELNVPYVFSRDYLISQKTKNDVPLYFETDTHWNSLGAYYSSQEIRTEIEKFFPETNFPKIEYEKNVYYRDDIGDILPILGLKTAKSTRVDLKPKNGEDTDYFDYIKNDGLKNVETVSNNKELPKAVIFRDSFTIYLVQFLSPLFSHADYRWKEFRDEDKAELLANKPDIIIFESVERYSRTILSDSLN